MYTILVKNDNSLQPSITDTRIIQGSKNIDYLRFHYFTCHMTSMEIKSLILYGIFAHEMRFLLGKI